MKTFLFFLAFSLSLIPTGRAQQQPGRGALEVQLSDGRPLSVVVNGRDYERRSTRLTVGDLPQGRHSIRVYALQGRHSQTPVLVYRGRIPVEAGAVTLVRVDAYNHSARVTVEDGTIGRGNEEPVSGRRLEEERTPEPRGNRPDRSPSPGTLSSTDLDDLRSRVASRTTDADKLSLIQSVLDSRRYTTEQLRTVAGFLTFESTRLTLLKDAYAGVADPANYWKLDDVFVFDSSKEELAAHIKGSR